MATYATLTVPVLDIIGADFNASRASVWIEPNVPVVLADSIRVGGRREQVVNGVATFANLVTTNSADNPASFGYRVTITAPPKGAQKREDIVTLTTSDFPFTATANLKDIEEAWDNVTAPPSWRSEFLTSVTASATAAAASATSAAASAALAQDIALGDAETVLAAAIVNPGPVKDNLSATIAAEAATPGGSVVTFNDARYATARTSLASSPIRKPRPTDYMVERFDTGHGWSIGGGWTTSNLNDTSAAVWGTQGVSGTTDGSGLTAPGTFGKAAATWTKFDPTTNILEFALTLDNPSRLHTMLVYVSSSGGLTTNNKAIQVLGPGEAATVMGPNETTIISVNLNEAGTITGSGAGTLIDSMRLWFRDTGQPVSVKVGGIRRHARVQPALPNGVVCFTYDDCFASQLDAARYLSKRAGKGTFYVGRDVLGAAGKLTLANLRNMQDLMGHEIGGHVGPGGHIDLTTLTADQLEAHLQAEKYWLTTNSFRSESYATPFGASNTAVRTAMAQYFRQARIVSGPPETLPPADPYRLRCVAMDATVTLAAAKARVDSAYTQGRMLTFLFHDIATGTPTGSQWAKADHEALIDYIATTYPTMPIMSVGDAMQLVA